MRIPATKTLQPQKVARGRPGRCRTRDTREDAVREAPEAASRRILLAEDDDELRRLVARFLRADGFEVTEARNGSELLDKLTALLFRSDPPGLGLVVTDLRMPGFSGLDILVGLRRAELTTPVILVTAFGEPELHAEARRLGALAVVDKPFDIGELREFIRSVMPPLA